ncbi:hypothetical protein C8F04DRAFT_1299279 [Mycena alexandri]|uniref:Uncharacterized protein n=1 Tax=Mycena alexandri TaxID=1745969 RepID=A0AAD6T8H9_9AGAR|nr:hypothetical protein C8F04DRAFT_1299279 [Mycena alexandri]
MAPRSSVSAPPPNLDDPSTDEESDRTSDRHLSMDPFIHLRAPELQQLIQLLADPSELNKRLKRPSRVLKLIEYTLPMLEKQIEVWPFDRGWHPDLVRLYYPLRFIYDVIDPAQKPRFERFQRLLIQKNKQFDNTALGPNWVMPDATHYFGRIGAATDEDRAALAHAQRPPSPPRPIRVPSKSAPAAPVETRLSPIRASSSGPSKSRRPQVVVSDHEDDPMEDETPARYTFRELPKTRSDKGKSAPKVLVSDGDSGDDADDASKGKRKATGEDSDDGTSSLNKRPKVQPGAPPPPVFPALPEDPPQETVPHQGFRGLFSTNLQDFPKSLAEFKSLPQQQRWMFDVRSITINSWWRNPSSSSPSTPLGYPWVPVKKGKPPTNVLPDEDSQQVQGATRLPHLVYTRKHAPKISDIRLQMVVVKLLEDPGYSCLDCILHGQFCEFRGFNVNCTTCSSLGRRNCSFTLSDIQLERFRIEAASWMDMGAQRTWNLCADLHASFIRAHTLQCLAVLDTQDFHQRFIDFAKHAGTTIKNIGSKQFLARFTESNSTESLRERLQAMVLAENTVSAKHAALENPAHVDNFDPDPAAHNGKLFSGPERHVPTVGEQNIRDCASQPAPTSTSKRRPKTNKFTDLANEGEDAESGVESDAPGEMDVDADAVGTGDGEQVGSGDAQENQIFRAFHG